MQEKLILCDDLIVQINAYSSQCLPEEACGLIAGIGDRSQSFLPVTNELHSPSAFRMDPQEQLNAFLWIESQSLEVMAVFHTHPNGPEIPSATDIAEFFYPGVLSVIWTPVSMRAFYIQPSGFTEIPVVFFESSN